MPNSNPNLSCPLAIWLQQAPPSHPSFPAPYRSTYFDTFKLLDQEMNEKVHPFVNQGAMAAAIKRANGEPNTASQRRHDPLWLTDHGPGHISLVMRRASELTSNTHGCILTPYEAYILLAAIHFHDVGNLFGREQHEKNIREIMASSAVAPILAGNPIEKRMIHDVATVHGGYFEGSRDTFDRLKYPRAPRPNEVRIHLLASILRFADELADDCTRTSRFLSELGLIPPECAIYHAFADCLQVVTIDTANHEVRLTFQLDAQTAARKYPKAHGSSFLFEEILARTLKLHREHLYCNRFLRPAVQLDRIQVKIELCENDYLLVFETITYEMQELGYPDGPKALVDICPNLKHLTGTKIKKRFREHATEDKSV